MHIKMVALKSQNCRWFSFFFSVLDWIFYHQFITFCNIKISLCTISLLLFLQKHGVGRGERRTVINVVLGGGRLTRNEYSMTALTKWLCHGGDHRNLTPNESSYRSQREYTLMQHTNIKYAVIRNSN